MDYMNKIAIFDTYKTNDQLTGKAKRQRRIIQILGSNFHTKVEIAKKIASEEEKSWKNMYSGIYEDIEDIFLPHEIISEKGRVPLKRGPQLLQKKGTPLYGLTKNGSLLLYCVEKGKTKTDFTKFTDDYNFGSTLNSLADINPMLCFLLVKEYVARSCGKKSKLVPITHENFCNMPKSSIKCNLDLVESILSCDKMEQEKLLNFLQTITTKH